MGWGGPTCRGCAEGFICGGGGVANTTEGGCPGGNEGCKRQEQGSKEREDSMEMQVIFGEKFFFILLKTLFRIKINLL